MSRKTPRYKAPYLGQDRGDLTVQELYEEEGEIGPGQRRERLLGSKREGKALAALARAAQQEKREQAAADRKLRKRK